MPVVVGQELAQAIVLLGVGARDHADEGAASAVAVLGHRQGRFDERGQNRVEIVGPGRDRFL